MAKYAPFGQIPIKNRKWPERTIQKAPIWCSVDLRDGNQALPVPMDIEQKLEYFDLLCDIGFKEIEVGFPSSNDTEFTYIRRLIDENRIPDDVSIQVLCQARENLIIKTMEAVKGARSVIFHLYNAVSPIQREFTFGKTKDELISMAVQGALWVKQYSKIAGNGYFRFEYSPEDFSGTECDYAVQICRAVVEAYNPEINGSVIVNLPSTVEHSTPNIYADQIEYFIDKLEESTSEVKGLISSGAVLISIHNHNDRGTGVACAELGLLAGASRIEGTLFGNGERTGNLDIITVAMNMYTQGIDIGLDFSKIDNIAKKFYRLTGMIVPPRQPYAGSLVYTAFSGSHQDAIRKALSARSAKNNPNEPWNIPYLPIDPRDVGREYEEIIRINSQSGKGGATWVLEQCYGILLPKQMQSCVGTAVKKKADSLQRELAYSEIYDIFAKGWLNTTDPLCVTDLAETHVDGTEMADNVLCRAVVSWKNTRYAIGAKGNGPLAAFALALCQTPVPHFTISAFHEHAIGSGSDTDAMAYVEVTFENGERHWGCGRSSNIGRAGVNAVVSAINRLHLEVI